MLMKTKPRINPAKDHNKSNLSAADPNDLQTTPVHDAGPNVYSCGIRGIRAALGWVLHKESEPIISDELACLAIHACILYDV